ncbi:alpha/beta hydrolase [Flavobacterium sp. CYK-4]|uniref:alpha/beta fold hydrolase n=1 Tax=Flavobacterium lotistagni TaxID=2709660 RepID=UPI001409CD33|nr:alpha/beta hydrolase [Flavobacterium lotistagni]NHM07206.1 alpha/beta hydrolase [Flavobacterium lotistagni]
MTKKAGKAHQTLKIPKIILLTGTFLSFISTKLTVLFAARLFTTPIKHKAPKREIEMDAKSKQQSICIPSIDKEIVVYHFGESQKKILLVHGWSGRGTQLVKFAEALLKIGYSTISFDAPAHGKSRGSTTLMPEFIASIMELEKQFGPFEAAIGHSLGGMSLLNAVKQGLNLKKLVIIGSGDIVQDIINDFVKKLELDAKYNDLLREHFENKHQLLMDSFSGYHAARQTDIPVLVIHDENDLEVPVYCAHHIHENLKRGELLLTQNLGHRKILGDTKVIAKSLNFITS